MVKRVGSTHLHVAGDGAYDVEVDLVGTGARHEPPEAGQRLHPVLDTPERERLRTRDRVCESMPADDGAPPRAGSATVWHG